MKFVKIGQDIKIENEFKNKVLLKSTIQKIESDRLYINCEHQLLNNFQECDEIYCTLFTEFGLRSFKSIVIEINKFLIIDYNPKDLEIIYKREFIRVQETMPAKIFINDEIINVFTKDIGGGGIKFLCEKELEINSMCTMSISLNFGDVPIKIDGRIVKYNYFKENEYLLMFDNINENIRSKIIKKCLDIQAEQIRKTLNDYE